MVHLQEFPAILKVMQRQESQASLKVMHLQGCWSTLKRMTHHGEEAIVTGGPWGYQQGWR